LIGPRGGTLQAIQELSRSALQRSADGRDTNRLKIDVAGYRERRRVALVDFAKVQAEQVKESGADVALEPMSSLDRKTVHDTIMDIEGVESTSEGDDPDRRVVLQPDH
ncbi:MAG: protein jag, partial [Acidimicrobiales bacterium]